MLFRKEAINNKKKKVDGVVLLIQPVSYSVITLLLLSIVVILISYLYVGDYTSKEVVEGYIQPSKGIVKVYSKAEGILETLYVKEGQEVKKGEPLARFKQSNFTSDGIEVNTAIIEELKHKIEITKQNFKNEEYIFLDKKNNLRRKIKNMNAIAEQYNEQLSILDSRIDLTDKNLKNMISLLKNDFISEQKLSQYKEDKLKIKQEKEELINIILMQNEKRAEFVEELNQLPYIYKKNINNLISYRSDLKQILAENKIKHSHEVVATRDGRITNILVKVGQSVKSKQGILSILPQKATLEAVLFIPTRSFGFMKKGQEARLRYHAFPYQRFGIYQGYIRELSYSVILPKEVNLPISLKEPMYKVIVDIEQPYIKAYGELMPLRVGMLLEADIVVDHRSLLDWLMDPIYSLKGRL